jgi:CheY-like chemotaxis protein
LVVEDEPLVLMVIVESLGDAGHEVLTADDAAGAIRLIEERPGHFTALVTDYNMPGGLTGAQLIERMRTDYPTIPIVLATALGNSVSTGWRRKHRVALLNKPFGSKVLVDLVERLLRKA